MNIGEWFKNLWNKFMAAFNSFIKDAFSTTVKLLIGEFKDFAIATIQELANTDLSSESKRNEAFKKIKEEAIKRGKELPDSVINILIELAVQKLKNTGI